MRKLISLLLTLALLATLVPIVFVNAADSNTIIMSVTEDTFLSASNDFNAGYGCGAYAAQPYLRMGDGAVSAAANKYALFKTSFSDISIEEGKTVTKAELIVNRVYDTLINNTAASIPVNFYNTTASWTSETYMQEWDNAMSGKGFLPNIPWGDNIIGYGVIDAAPDAVQNVTFPAVNAATVSSQLSFDITPVFKKAFPDGIPKSDSVLSVLAELDNNSLNYHLSLASLEYVDSSLRPYLKLTIGDIPELMVESKTEPYNPADYFEISFSNNITSASVSVNGTPVSDIDIKLTGTTLNFNYEYAPFATYDVTVDVTDVFGQKFTKTYNFTTGNAIDRTVNKAVEFHKYAITGTNDAVKKAEWLYYAAGDTTGSNQCMVIKVKMPDLSNGILENATLRFTNDYKQMYIHCYRLCKYIPHSDSVLSSFSYTELEDFFVNGERAGTVELEKDIDGTKRTLKADVTDYILECISESSNEYAYFVLASVGSSQKVTGSDTYYPTIEYKINSSPSLDISDKNISLAGCTLNAVEFVINTTLTSSFADSVELVDKDGLAVDSAAFSCDGSKVTLDSEVALRPNTEYSIIIKSGAADINGNTLAKDLTVQTFTTAADDFGASGIKILSDSFDTETGSFEEAASASSASVGDTVKAVLKVVNNESNAKSLFIVIASYDAYGNISGLSIASANAATGVYASGSITASSADKLVKAFALDGTTFAPISTVNSIKVK